MAIDTIDRDGRMLARKNAEHIIAFGDKVIKEIIDYCTVTGVDDLKLMDIMVLLASLGSVSDHMLLKIVGDEFKENCYQLIDDLHYLSLIEFLAQITSISNLMPELPIILTAPVINRWPAFLNEWSRGLKNICQSH